MAEAEVKYVVRDAEGACEMRIRLRDDRSSACCAIVTMFSAHADKAIQQSSGVKHLSGGNEMKLPGFTAEATLKGPNEHYRMALLQSDYQGVIAQSRMTCAFKAGRLAGRCLQLGYDHGLCMETAADFNQFCNDHDL